jgi:membrane fusion protein (multidrug efflux system)
LRDEVRRLREQQEQLRDALKSSGQPSNGQPVTDKPAEAAPETKSEDKAEQKKPEPPKPPFKDRARGFIRRHPLAIPIGAVLLIAVLIGGFFLLRYFNSYESTDDAQIDGHLDPIGARIAGTIIAVHVENDQFVNAGEVVAELDPRDYQVALEQARANYRQALQVLTSENPNVPITLTSTQTTVASSEADVVSAQAGVAAAQQDYDAKLASIREAQAQNAKAQSDLKRYTLLVGKDEISRQQYDAALAAAKSQEATVEASRASAEASRKALDQRRAQLGQTQTKLNEARVNAPRQVAIRRSDIAARQAAAAAAKAQLDQAELNLSYTKIVAPVSGVVTSKTAEVGGRVQPGDQLLSISQVDDIWVTANFKETQLERMRPGQSVTIHVDAFDADYQGYVADLPGASGERTSLLPPENATGNFVKVVQRLPVRIRFKAGQNSDHRLRLGMSVEPKVWL